MPNTPQTDAILVCREAASIRPVDSGSQAAAAARARPPPELVLVEPHGAVTHGIDRWAEAVMVISVHRIGWTAIRL
jgi:hypothetical protein